MQERRELTKGSVGKGLSYMETPYFFSNLAFKTGVISFSVSAFTMPFQAMLTHFQFGGAPTTAFSGGLFRGLYRGFLPYAVAGQKRGAVAVTAKQANREVEREVEEEEIESRLLFQQRWAGTLGFAQADLFLTSWLTNKAKLANVGILTKENFHWSFLNYGKLTAVNWGSRSVAGFVNFAALGFMGDYVSSFYRFDNDLYNKLAGGATAGVLATFLTTIPNSYADRKLLASKMDNGRLLTVSPFTMFSHVKSHVASVGTKEALMTFVKMNFLKEVLIRSPQAALTFGIIFGADYLMGDEPLKNFWPKKIPEIEEELRTHSKSL